MLGITKDWFEDCCYADEPYDDFEAVICPESWQRLFLDDFSCFELKAFCTYNCEDWRESELYHAGLLYDCYVWLDYSDTERFELAHFEAHDRDEAMRLLIAAAEALDF